MIRKCHEGLPFPFTVSRTSCPLNTLVATRMGEAASQVRQTSPASACLHRGPTTKQNRSDPSNHAQTPRVEGSGIYFRSDCMRRSVPMRRLPLRDAGRGATSVVCVVSRFPPSLTLIAAAASSAISLKAPLTAQESRSPAGFAQIETLPKVMRTPLVCAGQQTGSRASIASPPGTG
jgi:hypothetical protein